MLETKFWILVVVLCSIVDVNTEYLVDRERLNNE